MSRTAPPAARTGLRRGALGGLVLVVATSGLLTAAGQALADDPAVTIKLDPKWVFPGDQVSASGQTSTTQVRPVKLQLQDGATWQTVAQGSTAAGGTYQVTDPVARTGSYRVVVPPMTVKGVASPKLVSATKTAVASPVLANGKTLPSGGWLTSTNGTYKLWMRANGNLTLTTFDDLKTVIWQTGTGGHAGARLVMQTRGNLVLVDPDNKLLWNTGTYDASAELALFANGNVVIRNDSDQVLWDRTNGLATGAGASQAGVRGQSWVDARVPYSQSRYYTNKYGRYRTDCSGFVSMMWGLSSSYTTRTIPGITTTISKADLRPGDVLNAYNYHVVLFDGWANAEKTKYWAYEETPSSGAAHHVIPYPYWSSSRPGSFVPRRLSQTAAKAAQRSGTPVDDGGDAGPQGHPDSYAE